jgi:cytochrome oxidase Cu insertion factor (SCO1/SenC/PrrC family)
MISGRSCCATAQGIHAAQLNASTAALSRTRRCKILKNSGWAGETPMKVNDKAPDFTLQDEDGKELSLKDLRGKVVVLFFYPKASTPG